MNKIAVVGGGAAGMMAAVAAAEQGCKVTLFEHNEKLGKKIYITGKGRCNLTNACDPESFFENIPRNPRFLYSAFYDFDNVRVQNFFEEAGLELKTERGNRVFPVSDHASDVIRALEKRLRSLGVQICLNAHVTSLETAACEEIPGKKITGLCYDNGDTGQKNNHFSCNAVILATGGVGYASTGSDGSGLALAEAAGHTVTPLRPSLVGMQTKEDYITGLQGLSLRNVSLRFISGKKKLYNGFGELLFTHQGISGPLVLTAGSVIPDKYFQGELKFAIDLKPALEQEQLDARILRDFNESLNKQFKNALGGLMPAKLIPVMIRLSGIDPEKPVHSVTKEERHRLTELIKAFPGTVTGLCDFKEAIITRGGIRVKEVNPSTMESKLVNGLYLCGEMLDVDALTGGFNLQIAWSTGHLAGSSAES